MIKGKKILLIGNCYTTIASFREELVIELLGQGAEVFVSFPNHSHGEMETGKGFAQKTGCHFIEIKMGRRSLKFSEELRTMSTINEILTQVEPDCVLLFTVKPNIYGGLLCKKKHIPYMINITGLGSGVKRGIIGDLLRVLYIKAANDADCVFFQNLRDRQFFINAGYKSGKDILIPGSGVNVEKYRLLPYPESKCTNLLYTARVMREKGIDEFLGAAKAFSNNANVSFEICGDCEEDYMDELANLEKKGVITYNGRVSDVVPFLEKCSAVVIPTFYNEGISNCLLEAASCGRPVITTNRPGSAETVEDGVSGYLIKEKDTDDLITKIRMLAELTPQKRREMGEAGRKKIEKEFDRRFVIDRYMVALEKCLANEC